MTDTPIAQPSDLATYLDVPLPTDTTRMVQILGLAQSLCETIVTPCPTAALPVVLSVAGRAYLNVGDAKTLSLGQAHIGFGVAPGQSSSSGLYLTRADRRALRALANQTGAFTISMLPPNYTLSLPWWDNSGTDEPIV